MAILLLLLLLLLLPVMPTACASLASARRNSFTWSGPVRWKLAAVSLGLEDTKMPTPPPGPRRSSSVKASSSLLMMIKAGRQTDRQEDVYIYIYIPLLLFKGRNESGEETPLAHLSSPRYIGTRSWLSSMLDTLLWSFAFSELPSESLLVR